MEPMLLPIAAATKSQMEAHTSGKVGLYLEWDLVTSCAIKIA